MAPPSYQPPAWARGLWTVVVVIVTVIFAALAWLDSRYASKADVAIVTKDTAGIESLRQKIDAVDSKVTDLRILLAESVKRQVAQ